MPTYTLNVNGVNRTVTVPSAEMPLLWVLRDYLGLTGTKYGCGKELCGACAVMVGNKRELSCDMDVSSAVGKKITTIEGLAKDAQGAKAQAAWVANQVPQCGFCQSGMITATTAAMKAGKHGKELASEVKHICVCGTYPRISKAMNGL